MSEKPNVLLDVLSVDRDSCDLADDAGQPQPFQPTELVPLMGKIEVAKSDLENRVKLAIDKICQEWQQEYTDVLPIISASTSPVHCYGGNPTKVQANARVEIVPIDDRMIRECVDASRGAAKELFGMDGNKRHALEKKFVARTKSAQHLQQLVDTKTEDDAMSKG